MILLQGLDLVPDRDDRSAAHDHPMLGAMMMHLQRQPPPRLDHDALDLVAVAAIERLVRAPGPMHLEMFLGHRRGRALELLHQLLHVANARALGDQDGVLARDHHRVVDAEQRNQRLVRGDIGVVRLDKDGVAAHRIARRILAREVPHRVP